MTPPPFDAICQSYLDAALRGQRRAAWRALERALQAGHSARAVTEHVLIPAQRTVGELWQDNEIGVGTEHLATAIAEVAESRLFSMQAPAPAVGHRVVLACAPYERHAFPARLMADAFELAGFDVRFLGAETPVTALVEVLTATRPDVVGLSASLPQALPSLIDALRAAAATQPSALLLAGGDAVQGDASLPPELRVLQPTGSSADVVQRVLGELAERRAEPA